MDSFHGRAVFFVSDAEKSLAFYTEKLGFAVDWNHRVDGRAFVFQVSLFGFQLILNQIEEWTKDRAGHGRVFIGLDESQAAGFHRHIQDKGIPTTSFHWGGPTLVIRDIDENEFFFWLPERASLEAEIAQQGVEPP